MQKGGVALTNLAAHRDKPTLHDEEARVRDVRLVLVEQQGHAKVTRGAVERDDVRVLGRPHGDDRRKDWREAPAEEHILPLMVCAQYCISDFLGRNDKFATHI